MNLNASKPIENNPPTADIGPAKPLGNEIPGDHRSGPSIAMGSGSFQNRHGWQCISTPVLLGCPSVDEILVFDII
jgi:hypothetical protein